MTCYSETREKIMKFFFHAKEITYLKSISQLTVRVLFPFLFFFFFFFSFPPLLTGLLVKYWADQKVSFGFPIRCQGKS